MTEPIRVKKAGDYDERAPYTFVVGNNTDTTRLEYKGEELPGLVAAAMVVGDVEDILDVATSEKAFLLLKIRSQYVRIQRDEATLHGGEIEIEIPKPVRL